ncbi:glycosyltransferase family 4 protein [Cellulosimicrobium sp. NPDC057127]|uniref:glycosyltransferase family 4 protein n=1 Tax=Cellulosimicrobium sp. NPDC057127 TaxID=3346026 RepID=UPI00363F0535
MRARAPLHVAVVGPVNVAQLEHRLAGRDAETARRQPTRNVSAPGVIVDALLDAGHRVTVVTHLRGEPPLELHGEALRVVRVPSRADRWAQVGSRWRDETRAMARAVQGSGADVVHTHWAYEAALAGVRSGLPHVATVRDAPLTVLRYYRTPMRVVRATMAYEFRARSSRAVLTAPSPYLARAWQRQTLTRRPVRVVPNIAPDDFRGVARRAPHPTFLEVSDAGARKNVRGLVRSFARVRAELPGAELRVVGEGLGEDGECARWARAHGLAAGVVFLGPRTRPEVVAEMSSAWIHVHAALEETFGNTLVEAMAAGVPVIAGTRSGAVPWVLDGGSAGALADVTDDRALAAAMLALARSGARRRELASRAQAHVRAAFSAAAVAERYADAYHDVVRGRRDG